MLLMVKACEVQRGDKIVVRTTSGRISELVEVLGVSNTCTDFSQVHIVVASARFEDKHIGKLGRTECWFMYSELEVKRND